MTGLATVLVVDDEPAVREPLRRFIQGQGHLVLEAESVHEALMALRDMPIHAVVLDVRLGEGSGLDVLRFIRTQRHTMKLPVLLLTAYAPTTMEQALINQCSAMVFYKPVGSRAVLHHLSRLIRRL